MSITYIFKTKIKMTFEDLNWYSGLLIKPQHFQHIKLNNYFNIFNILNSYHVGFWGIYEFKYDANFIQEGKIIIHRLKALHKDGSIIDYDYMVDVSVKFIINLNDKDFALEDSENIIYCCVVKNNPKHTDNSERYFSEVFGPVRDSNSSIEEDENLIRLKVKPYFLSQREILSKHLSFPILKVSKVKDSWFLLPYSTSVIFFTAESDIIVKLTKTLSKLELKLDSVNNKIISSIKNQYLDYKTFINVRNYDSLIADVINFKIYLENGIITPIQLHKLLNNLLVKLFICNNEKVKYFSFFNHEDLDKTFNVIISHVEVLAENILNDSTIFLPFDYKDEMSITAHIDDYMHIKNSIYIQCSSAIILNYSDVINELLGFTIASESSINDAISIRVSGIKRQVITDSKTMRDLTGISNLENVVYLALETNSNYFKFREKLVIFAKKELLNKYKFSLIYPRNEKS